jgi:putative two-component system response regulator
MIGLGAPATIDARPSTTRLLIVDDEPRNVLLLRDMLGQAGYLHVESTSDPRETRGLRRSFSPDLILLDLMMPNMDGMAVMAQLKADMRGRHETPILMLTADISPQTKRRALAGGAKDFLTKPFDALELLLRIGNLLETHFLQVELERQNDTLEERVRARTEELESARGRILKYALEFEQAQIETLERLARAGEFRDDDTGQHTLRVAETTALLAQRIGFPDDRLSWLQQASRLHDVGKIGISDSILLKPGKLTVAEFDTMKNHTIIGAELLQGGQSELFQIAQRIAASHHEHWDGAGYPEGLCGAEIPIEARLVAVADVFDALTHDRPYKEAWSVPDAVEEIRRESGAHFDPEVVEEFLELYREERL